MSHFPKKGHGGGKANRLKSVGGVTVSKRDKLNSIAHAKKYEEDGRVEDRDNNEEKIALAMKARRARRDEVVGVGTKPLTRLSVGQSMKIPRIEKSTESYRIIRNALHKNLLFNDCSEDQIDMIIYAMKPKKIARGTKIIVEGDEGYNFYVVQKGRFEYSKTTSEGKKKIGEAKGGDCFGELALLYYAPRAVTVTAVITAEVWKLDRVTFRQILDSSYKVKRDRIRSALKRATIFEDFAEEKLEAVVDIAHYQSFRSGDVIIKKGDKGSIFYVVVAGRVQVTKAGDLEELNDTIFEAGDYFGERALIKNEPRNANVIAIEDTDVVALDKQSFDKYLGSYLKLLDHNLGLRVLKSVDMLNDLHQHEFEELCEELMTETFKKGKMVIKQGEVGKKFFIIKSGQVDIIKEDDVGEDGNPNIVASLGTGSYFGEFALLDDKPRVASAIAKTDCVFFTLDRENFEKLFGPLESIGKKAQVRKSELLKKKTSTIETIEEGIKLEDLTLLQMLGTGTFGRVKLVKHSKTDRTFALKILQKEQIVQYKQQDNVMNEKNILKQSNHPFILKLYATYRDTNCLYMLLELVQGGELFTLLHNSEDNKLDDGHARFYAAGVIDALHYLHNLHIVYRDLKPENLMIDTDGYIKVVDFGFAKKVTQKTYTLCGTPEYLAPELVLQKGHNRAVDYWAVGVLIFEMLNGVSPFADLRRNEQITICRNIVRMKYDFPKSFPNAAKSIVEKLLRRYPHERLGMAREGAQEIKNHRWFKSTNWNKLTAKQAEVPWKPPVKDNLDISCFDDYEDEEEIMEYTHHDLTWDESF